MPQTSDDAVPVGDSAARLAIAVGRINRRVRPRGDGLSHGLISALSTIVRQGPIRPSELARVEAVAAPTATRAVSDLEARGLVVRTPDPEDGRSSLVRATDDGVLAVMHARTERAERVSALLETLDADQRASIWAALDALEAAAGIQR